MISNIGFHNLAIRILTIKKVRIIIKIILLQINNRKQKKNEGDQEKVRMKKN